MKYPPIQGGVSAQSYWLCRRLAERGHHVTVVTNAAEVDPEYRIWLDGADLGLLQGDFPSGGVLAVRWTGGWDEARWHHIPTGNPAHEKLSSLAIETVRAEDCELILSYYLQPYGLAAAYASRVTGVPYLTRHAGSDRYSLMKNPDLRTIYAEVLSSADSVITAGDDLAGLQVTKNRLIVGPDTPVLPADFSPDGERLDLNATIARLAKLGCPAVRRADPIPAGTPVVGMYGKVGRTKGTYALLEVISSAEFRNVSLVLMCGGILLDRVTELIGELGLADRVWTLPFLPHWRVPQFIRACDLVAALEHDFPIPQHGPSILTEILSCGSPALASAEVYRKLPEALQSAPGLTVVDAPGDLQQLRTGLAAALGASPPEQLDAAAARVVAELKDQGVRELDRVIDEIEGRYGSGPVQVLRTQAHRSPDTVILALDLLSRHAPELLARNGPLIAGWLPAIAAAPDRNVTAVLVRLADQAVEQHWDDQDWAEVLPEADLLWLACDVETAAGTAQFPLPPGGLPVNVADADGWTDPAGDYQRCPLASAMLRLRVYPGPAMAALHRRRQTVIGRRSGRQEAAGVLGAGAAGPGSDPCAVVIAKDGSLEGKVIVVGPVVHEVLRAADGTVGGPELAARCGLADDRLAELLSRLASAGLIQWISYPVTGPPTGMARLK